MAIVREVKYQYDQTTTQLEGCLSKKWQCPIFGFLGLYGKNQFSKFFHERELRIRTISSGHLA